MAGVEGGDCWETDACAAVTLDIVVGTAAFGDFVEEEEVPATKGRAILPGVMSRSWAITACLPSVSLLPLLLLSSFLCLSSSSLLCQFSLDCSSNSLALCSHLFLSSFLFCSSCFSPSSILFSLSCQICSCFLFFSFWNFSRSSSLSLTLFRSISWYSFHFLQYSSFTASILACSSWLMDLYFQGWRSLCGAFAELCEAKFNLDWVASCTVDNWPYHFSVSSEMVLTYRNQRRYRLLSSSLSCRMYLCIHSPLNFSSRFTCSAGLVFWLLAAWSW